MSMITEDALARVIYTARFAHEPARCVTKWEDLSGDAVAIWHLCARTALSLVGSNPSVIDDIVAERQRQVARGYTAEHDDEHATGEIISGEWGAVMRLERVVAGIHPNPRDGLVQAAALVVAEIERLDRAAS
jgi:hypothetical protein